jgi:hypothetical protein
MTFSSASVSACEVDDVAATAAGATCLRTGAAGAARWRPGTAGAAAGAAVAAGAVSLAATVATGTAVVAATVLPLVVVVLGTKLRAIGRGFGKGTLGLAAQASVANADKPSASVRLVARAVDRKAAARTRRFTAFLRGESSNRLGFRSI